MLREQLRESLDTALMFQKLMDTFRDVVELELKNHPSTNDELSLLMATAYNGLGNVKIQLFNVVGLINERISWMGEDEGIKKLVPPLKSYSDGTEDFLIGDELPEDEWHQSDASDEDEFRDEWEIEENDDDDSTPEK